MLRITDKIIIDDKEILETFSRSSGPGGQHVNKVETSVTLKFSVINSPSLVESVKKRLESIAGQKYNKKGQIVINVDKYRSQIRNRQVARSMLASLIKSALIIPKPRVKTKPSKSVNKKRLDSKTKRGKLKTLRKNKVED
ncbi:MAG: alternative ribosome rescue aminoacyl-tRNA hydrolase ArfB [Paracoccaceae bacterium]|nr:alternative ribosome rescue aminoacyl-tRNA hydrolase ArfB [Paracoccaceae bacterium]